MDSESSSDEDDDDEDEKSSQPVLHVSNLFHVSDALLGDYKFCSLITCNSCIKWLIKDV